MMLALNSPRVEVLVLMD